jgi:hypothetical protein
MSNKNKAITLQSHKDINRKTGEVARQRIQAVKIVDRLNQCALGEIDMTAQQLKAAAILIDKVISTKQELTETVEHHHSIPDATRALLEGIVARLPNKEKVIEPITIDNDTQDVVLKATDYSNIKATNGVDATV